MAINGCIECKTAPKIKCQRCKNFCCKEHQVSPNNYPVPYRLCWVCYLEFLDYLLLSNWKNTAKNLCCLINGNLVCYYCDGKFCEKHLHQLTECLIWLKWKWSPRKDVGNSAHCCIKWLRKEFVPRIRDAYTGNRCYKCSFITCPDSSHKIDKRNYCCALCGEKSY